MSKKPFNCCCLDIAGMLNFTRKGTPIADCNSCNGTGYTKEKTGTMQYFAELKQKTILEYNKEH